MANFGDAITSVLLNQPFFGQLLMRYEHVEQKDFPAIAAVTRTSLIINPEKFAELTDDEGVFVVSHEVMHGAYLHLDEMEIYGRSGIGPDGKPYDQMKYNRAADYVINDLLKHNKIGSMPSMGCWSQAYTYAMTPGDVYSMLPDDPNQDKGGQGGNGGFDQHDASGGDDPSKPDAVTAADVVQAAATAQAMGAMPLGLDRLIDGLKKPTHSPWAVLRKMVMTALGGNDASTWRRLNRKLIARGLGAPGRAAYGCNKVGVVVDTSGSIGEDMLRMFGGHMGAILSDARPKEILVYWVDHAVHRRDSVKNGGALRTLLSKPVPGGGGTNMPEGVNAAMADGCEAVVVLTDGYTPFGDAQKRPVIWGITTEIKAPHGTTVRLVE